ncbi:MAG TPA: SEC-C metal-binding domain-containing protein, partial [Clostridia bacterium]|nr:SEC-C metal-binding domain-containing protein [Clostridia bacterium]
EDDLMRLFGSERIAPMIERLGLEEDQPIEAGMLTKQIESAQKRIEGRNYDIRKQLLDFDNFMSKQREVIYGQRRQVLEGMDMRQQIMNMVHALIEEALKQHAQGDDSEAWALADLTAYLERHCLPIGWMEAHHDELLHKNRNELLPWIEEAARALYAQREAAMTEGGIDMRELERVILLSCVDRRWMDHIDAMDHLRDGIGLRALGQRDPVVEYKFEGFEMFDEMVRLIREDTLLRLFHAQVQRPPERKQVAQPTETRLAGDAPAKPKKADAKVGRNDPCPCGSGKKYKHCCGKA